MSADLQFLVGKILSDEEFAESLVEDPEKTLEENGIEPTVDLLDALQGIDLQSLKNMASAFNENKAAL